MKSCAAVALLLVCGACGRENFDGTRDAPPGTDHDQDGHPDAADNCPAHFNENQTDGDGDEVGDSCDPNPAQAGDRLVAIGLFSQGFGDWSPDSVQNWSLADGKATTTNPVGDATLARITLMKNLARPTVYAAFVVDDYGTNFGHELDLGVSYTTDNWTCRMHDGAGGGELNVVELLLGAGSTDLQPIALPVARGTIASVWLTRKPDEASCGALGATTVASMSALPGGLATVRLDVSGFKASLLHAVVYDVP